MADGEVGAVLGKFRPEAEKAKYLEKLESELSSGNVVGETSLLVGHKTRGKVRDVYETSDRVALVATDRLSAFDRNLLCVPRKGAVLTGTSAWWFEQTKDLCRNHVLERPHPSVLVCRRLEVFPIEFVVRGFITGSTSTSMWTHYARGEREYCGHKLEEGLRQHERLPTPLVTPTTKDALHDRPISGKEIVEEGWMSKEDWEEASELALQLFRRGQRLAEAHGLLLVDTKYEMAKDGTDGRIVLVDEIHTPDSSRYWLRDTYEACMKDGKDPAAIDKEFVRRWYRERFDPYGELPPPVAPPSLIAELARRYILLHDVITSTEIQIDSEQTPLTAEILARALGQDPKAARALLVVTAVSKEDLDYAQAFKTVSLETTDKPWAGETVFATSAAAIDDLAKYLSTSAIPTIVLASSDPEGLHTALENRGVDTPVEHPSSDDIKSFLGASF